MIYSKDSIISLMAAMDAHDVRLLQTEGLTIERFEAAEEEDDGPEDGEKEPIWPRAVGE